MSLPFDSINVLVQTRKYFDPIKIINLASEIDSIGLIQPIGVAWFNKKACQGYIHLINRNRRKKYSIKKLKKYKNRYPVLIYGEKRFRALKCIFENTEGNFTQQFFPAKEVRAQVFSNLTSWGFLKMQCSENIYDEPKPEELAEFYSDFYKEFKELEGDSELTLTAYAKTMGTSVSTMRDALRFSSLPKSVKAYVNSRELFNYRKSRKLIVKRSIKNQEEHDLLSYGIICQIARLHQAGLEESKLIDWCKNCLVNNYKVEKFKKIVQEYLQRKNGISLFDEFTQAEQQTQIKNNRRRALEQKLTSAIYSEIQYIKRILYLFDNDLLGKEESAFSSIGVLKTLKIQVDLLKKNILPHIYSLVDDPYFKSAMNEAKAKNIIKDIEQVSEVFQKNY